MKNNKVKKNKKITGKYVVCLFVLFAVILIIAWRSTLIRLSEAYFFTNNGLSTTGIVIEQKHYMCTISKSQYECYYPLVSFEIDNKTFKFTNRYVNLGTKVYRVALH